MDKIEKLKLKNLVRMDLERKEILSGENKTWVSMARAVSKKIKRLEF